MSASPAWMDRAACLEHDPETWHPLKGEHERRKDAKTICNGRKGNRQQKPIPPCPVREQCLAWALEVGQDHGVWGGLSEDERRALKRRNARSRVRTA